MGNQGKQFGTRWVIFTAIWLGFLVLVFLPLFLLFAAYNRQAIYLFLGFTLPLVGSAVLGTAALVGAAQTTPNKWPFWTLAAVLFFNTPLFYFAVFPLPIWSFFLWDPAFFEIFRYPLGLLWVAAGGVLGAGFLSRISCFFVRETLSRLPSFCAGLLVMPLFLFIGCIYLLHGAVVLALAELLRIGYVAIWMLPERL